MFINHPINDALINISEYKDIRCCPKNPTHVDFYLNPQTENERGTPDYTIEFKTQEQRDNWFSDLRDICSF